MWIPIEHRPITDLQNVEITIDSKRDLSGYLIGPEKRTVLVIFADRMIRYSYDHDVAFQSAISYLVAQQIPKIDFLLGALKLLVIIAALFLLIKVLALVGGIKLENFG